VAGDWCSASNQPPATPKENPAVSGGVDENYWMGVGEIAQRCDSVSVRFKEEFKRQKTF
jgi:hypothetical protein